jgi:sugar/nucleoside kinase (ribokinase family)
LSAPAYDVLVVGNYTIDLIFSGLTCLPPLGGEVIASGFAMVPGESFIPAVGMHRLGLKVGWAGDFGNDELSRMALQAVRAEGLDERLFGLHDRPLRRTSASISMTRERSFVTYYDPDPTIPAAVKALATTSARIIYVPGLYYGPFLQAGVAMARARGMGMVMDCNLGPTESPDPSAVHRALRSVDIIMPNAREARLLTGKDDLAEAAHDLVGLTPLVVIKDGANGAYAIERRESILLHAPALDLTPVDTTGAGDMFNAGFIKAWLAGKPLMECLRWGNATGGLSTLAAGGAGRVIREEDVLKVL